MLLRAGMSLAVGMLLPARKSLLVGKSLRQRWAD
jgi:hypothetical protein